MNAIQTAAAAGASMTSREIAELTGRRHDQVLRTARELVAEGVTQSVETPYLHEQNGQHYPQHLLSKRDSLVLVASLSPEFTGRVIDRWIELEAAATVALPDFANPAAAARAWADAIEAKQALQVELEAAKPALAFVDKYVKTEAGKGFREVCKLLGAREPHFRAFLRDEKIMYFLNGDWAPYAQHMDAGRFVVKTGAAQSGHAFTRTLFTPKGVNWIAGEWAKHQLRAHVPFASRAPAAEVRA
jgi:phage antirepressor YoqD-like protein